VDRALHVEAAEEQAALGMEAEEGSEGMRALGMGVMWPDPDTSPVVPAGRAAGAPLLLHHPRAAGAPLHLHHPRKHQLRVSVSSSGRGGQQSVATRHPRNRKRTGSLTLQTRNERMLPWVCVESRRQQAGNVECFDALAAPLRSIRQQPTAVSSRVLVSRTFTPR
jgi:hypothetical protein